MTTILHPALQELDAAAAAPPQGLPSLLGTTREEFERFAEENNQPSYRGRQIFSGLFKRRVAHFADFTDLSKAFRAQLQERFDISRPQVDTVQVSSDGTRKYRFISLDGAVYEAVYIPVVARQSNTNTLCVSSQTGCAVGCRFCYTASLRRNRNLSAAEIVGQVLAVQDDVSSLEEPARVTNIVFMGMGEPLLNYDEVVRSIRVLTDADGADFSTRRVTVSTAGIVPRIYELGKDVRTQLAVSLNATTDEVRNRVMPINKKWPLAELIAAMRAYPLHNRRRITVEYVLLRDVNDTVEDARRLVRLLRDIPVKVNILPLNAHDRTEFLPPEPDQVWRFQEEVRKSGLAAILRTPRGQDIAAACGQLGETVNAQV
ncbi:MAG: 23S rRNA (adenine(2503)-C(2))-methyltransferase RlmN [Myxococcota bacterium]